MFDDCMSYYSVENSKQQQQASNAKVNKSQSLGVDTDRNNSIMQKVLKTNVSSGGSRTIQGVVIEDIKIGSGAMAKSGNRIKVHYLGKLTNGTTFDACLKKPFPFRLGKGEVIRGWDIGCEGMMVGGEFHIT